MIYRENATILTNDMHLKLRKPPQATLNELNQLTAHMHKLVVSLEVDTSKGLKIEFQCSDPPGLQSTNKLMTLKPRGFLQKPLKPIPNANNCYKNAMNTSMNGKNASVN